MMSDLPDYASMMFPILTLAGSVPEVTNKIAVEAVRTNFSLTPEQMTKLLPSGLQTVVSNRAAWAINYLTKAVLLARKRRGVYQITQRGVEVLNEHPLMIDARYLRRFPEFVAYVAPQEEAIAGNNAVDGDRHDRTPAERLDEAEKALNDELKTEVLDRVLTASPTFFEKLVVKLLVAMGYGGTLPEAGEHIGGPGDGGVDGVIKLDALGIDKVYIQAKRYALDSKIGRKEIQAFSGALDDKQTTRGVFIATCKFSPDAANYVRGITKQIVLIDGSQLADFLVRYGVGLRTERTISVKRIDEDFFDEE